MIPPSHPLVVVAALVALSGGPLDAEYRSFLSRYKKFALSPGRDVVLRASTAW